jgi:hypothetical protein
MASIRILINNKLQLSIQQEYYQYVNIGFIISSGQPDGELRFDAISKTDSAHKIWDPLKLMSGDTIIISNTFGPNKESCFPIEKKNLLKEACKETNAGNPCKSHLHISVDRKDRYIVYGTDSTEIVFDYFWLSENNRNEFSVGTTGSNGTEQWIKTCIPSEHFIELLYLNN